MSPNPDSFSSASALNPSQVISSKLLVPEIGSLASNPKNPVGSTPIAFSPIGPGHTVKRGKPGRVQNLTQRNLSVSELKELTRRRLEETNPSHSSVSSLATDLILPGPTQHYFQEQKLERSSIVNDNSGKVGDRGQSKNAFVGIRDDLKIPFIESRSGLLSFASFSSLHSESLPGNSVL